MEGLTTGEAAKHLKVPQSTLKFWLSELPIMTLTDGRGRRRLNPDALAVLETVKDMRDKDHGLQTIRRRIVSTEVNKQLADGQELVTEADNGESTDSQELISNPNQAIMPLMAAIRAQTELADKFAAANHRIGELEERCRHLEAQLVETRAISSAAKPWWRFW